MTWMLMASTLVAGPGTDAPPVPAEAVEEVLEALAWEPDCASVVEAALAAGPPPGHVASARRARLAALLPRLRVTVEKSLEHDQSLDQDDDGGIDLSIDTDDDLQIRGYLQWDLSHLVLAPAEASLAGRRLDDVRWRLDLASDVVRAYHERKKLLVLIRLGAVPDPVEVLLRVEELAALMDALTDGWFLKELERRRKLQEAAGDLLPGVPFPPI